MAEKNDRGFLGRHGLAIFLVVLGVVLFLLFSGYPT
jgi:hypothetical protein